MKTTTNDYDLDYDFFKFIIRKYQDVLGYKSIKDFILKNGYKESSYSKILYKKNTGRAFWQIFKKDIEIARLRNIIACKVDLDKLWDEYLKIKSLPKDKDNKDIQIFDIPFKLLEFIIGYYKDELPYDGKVDNFILENEITTKKQLYNFKYQNNYLKKFVNNRITSILAKDLLIAYLSGRIKEYPSFENLKKLYIIKKGIKI